MIMDKFSFLGSTHTLMIEDMYNKYLQDPLSIEEEWSNFFKGFDFGLFSSLLCYSEER